MSILKDDWMLPKKMSKDELKRVLKSDMYWTILLVVMFLLSYFSEMYFFTTWFLLCVVFFTQFEINHLNIARQHGWYRK